MTRTAELQSNARRSVAEALAGVLADTFQLYLKTHASHWNVTGPEFPALHELFATQYTEMWNALDEIAERIRALGAMAPSSPAAFAALSTIAPAEGPPSEARRMVLDLLAGHEQLIARAREALSIADEAGDAASADLLTVRVAAHEKTAWMLRATAG
ncbi:MAG: DNA starvation/stationary phase protection protein [Parvularculaceae bacterium]